ncbi:hypothetical protein GA0111570_106143 [Raineyella antarctica]|uniref:DUF6458 domain-containing protein n=1 Tax=Raineyella antarctica TaxID=1577474 RepID=A0A1G6H3Z5_9ACTN|nr:DUF6458 family protein [Raineyella antarctica]SDB88891.1 hypothetical protein GA0111570_106143 [Raineyella antarctica]
MRSARIGTPIALIVIGAILKWAVADAISGINLPMIGLILIVAGAIWLVLEIILGRPRTHVTTERTNVQGTGTTGPAGDQHVEREIRRDDI